MIEWIEGFDTYGSVAADTSAAIAGNWAVLGAFGTVSFDSTHARTGTHSLHAQVQNINTEIRRVFSDLVDKSIVGHALWLSALPDSDFILGQFLDGDDNSIVSFCCSPTGTVRVYHGDLLSGNLVGESDPIITPISFNFIEMQITPSSAVCRVNRKVVVTVGGMSNDPVNQWGMLPFTFGANVPWWLDDLHAQSGNDIDFIGDAHVYTLFPDGDDTPLDWANSTGSTSFSLIDEVGPNTTDYISSSTVDDATQVTLSDLPTEAINIYGVQAYSYMKKTGAGAGEIKQTIISGTDATNDDGHSLSTEYNYYKGNFQEDPAGGHWTRTAVNNAKLRLTRTS